MGYLTERYIKDKSKKYYIYIALDIMLILALIWFGLTLRGEFENGAKFMLQNVPAFCINNTLYQKALDYYNVTPNVEGIFDNIKVKP